MKRLVGLLGAAFLTACVSGCGDDTPKVDDTAVTKDNRPAGFENMMKGMQNDMKKAGANPKGLSKK